MWNVTDCQKVVFSDESRFFFGTDDNHVRVWRHPGELYNSLHTANSAGLFLNSLTWAIFQQDNARPHTARVAQDFLRHFQTLSWPARSPNLSSVENVWDQLKRQMPSCHSVHDLELAVQDMWALLPQDNIRCLINSTPDRVAACIAAGGGPTRYCSCPVFMSLHTLYSTAQRYHANGSHCEAMVVLTCPKPIPYGYLVSRPKRNIAFVGFIQVNNEVERNNIRGNAQICHSRRMEQSFHR
ncbi:transposable element Tcb2 transposase [Trichonephila clavipes]|nr:transposable element Tcb2 transposase [Trichonephila clavipes]